MVMDPDLLDFRKDQYEFYRYMKKDEKSHNKKLEDPPEFSAAIDSYSNNYEEQMDQEIKAS